MVTPLIMLTASEGSTVRIFTIHFTWTAGATILMVMIRTIHGIHLHGQCRGTGVGDIVGTHLILITGDMVIRLITVTGTDLIMAMEIPTTIHGTDMVVAITEVITTVAGMQILKTTVTEEGLPALQMCVTETGQAVIWQEHLHAHHQLKALVKEMQDGLPPKAQTLIAEVHQALV